MVQINYPFFFLFCTRAGRTDPEQRDQEVSGGGHGRTQPLQACRSAVQRSEVEYTKPDQRATAGQVREEETITAELQPDCTKNY